MSIALPVPVLDAVTLSSTLLAPVTLTWPPLWLVRTAPLSIRPEPCSASVPPLLFVTVPFEIVALFSASERW